MSNYYKEKQRALRQADFLINEILYIEKEWIDLRKVDLKHSGNFQCNFMKVFHERLALHMETDKNIHLDENEQVVMYKEDS